MKEERRHKKLFGQRRKQPSPFRPLPWYKVLVHRLERLNKKLSVNLVGKLLGVKPRTIPIPPDQIRSILFIRNDAIGDMVMATPLWRNIKERYPSIRVGVAGSFRNMPVIESDPDVDVRIDLSLDSLAHTVRGLRLARRTKWDLVIGLIYNKKTKMAVLARLMAPRASTTMILYAGDSVEHYAKLFSAVAPAPYMRGDIHMIDVMKFHLLSSIILSVPDDEWRPSLRIDPKVLEKVSQLTSSILKADGTSGYIHINLEAAMPFRELGIEKNIELAKLLLEKFPSLSVLCTCSPVSAPHMNELIIRSNVFRLHLFPTARPQELFALVRFALLVISPDTSVIHVASAEGKPTVGIYAHPNEWTPYKVPNRVVVPIFGEPVSAISPHAICEAVAELLDADNIH
jgi:ADP-heptose:LPS heptosyltransferase